MAEHERLKTYLDSKVAAPFSWRDNNCMSFVIAYLGLPDLPVTWFLGHDTPRACYAAYLRRAKETGYGGLSDAFDHLLQREITLHPRTGYVVARANTGRFKGSYGLHWMGQHYFLTETRGLQPFDPEHADVYWSVP